MDLRTTLAVSGYAGAKPGTEPAASQTGGNAADMAKSFTETMRESEEVAVQAMTGDADPQALVQALAETELAVETAVTIRDRVVEAYQEILRMPV